MLSSVQNPLGTNDKLQLHSLVLASVGLPQTFSLLSLF
jgi:hypothetical protein